MDALKHADQGLARAKAHRADIVTPDSVTSPRDRINTEQISQAMVAGAAPQAAEPDDTMVVSTTVFGRDRGDCGPSRPWR
jgi:hypothetical protein